MPRDAAVPGAGPSAAAVPVEVPDEEHGSIAAEFGAWAKAAGRLAEARWRLARQRLVNRHGLPGAGGRVAGLAPAVGIVALVVFGALFGLRLVQESSPGAPEGPVGAVAAIATSTDAVSPPGLERPSDAGPSVIVVHPGDSLWSIAVERYPEHDPRAVIEAFVDLNGASTIEAGQQLVVPVGLVRN